jgi:hypothetical protein
MDSMNKTIHNSALAGLTQKAPQNVLKAIQNASANTGVDFSYMVQQAAVESSFNPAAKARGSSATGLYQFIESTWLSMVNKYGDKHGMGQYAAQISDNGKVSSKAMRREILELRKDPEKASAMAAEFARENEDFLQANWSRGKKEIGSTELYLAHFLGAGGAAAFLNARDESPMQQAALIFPEAAKSNRNVFYDTRTGRPKSLDEVYAFFDNKFTIEDDTSVQAMVFADASNSRHIAASGAPLPPSLPKEKIQIDSPVFLASTADWSPPQKTSGAFYESGHFRAMMHDPVQVMLLSQLEAPGESKNSKLF